MENELLAHLDKLHTTALGAVRIRRNMGLDEWETLDAVEWCRQKIRAAAHITRQGKNWYADIEGGVITVNAHSYTIITAHKDKG